MSIQIEQVILPIIPRPEYPRPDWQRADWLNLNGTWSFQFDADNQGKAQAWFGAAASSFSSTINVPFSWTNPLSGIASSEKGIGWYSRSVEWTPADAEESVFLRFGAVDYICDVWVNGISVGSHQGGYGTFEFDVTTAWLTDSANLIVVRAEDFDHSYQTRGKQGYGEIRGIWQTVWLEARPFNYVLDAKFTTHLDGLIEVTSQVAAKQTGKAKLTFSFSDQAVEHEVELDLVEGINEVKTSFQAANPQLWSPDSPFLYEGEIQLSGHGQVDSISTYFGIREISTTLFADRSYRWITLNGKPIYLNGTLDQSFHPEGYFTFPTDQDMHDEIFQMKRLGLNFVRIHIKPEEPRKLYWADKLGLLVMEDMPCFWGDPDEQARAAYENEARELIDRDFNHPSIFSWIVFNETWGLKTDSQATNLASDGVRTNEYLPETQEWVRCMYHWVKQMDPTRLVEDNSPCNNDHVISDINTWHFYINGYDEVRTHVAKVVDETFVGSGFNYIGGNLQTDAPLMNSECGNVWGMEFGAGDSDLAWHYRYMMNEFRRHDKMCGFVFTEFRDVLNEFNGYHRIDGSDKQFGYEWFVPGMQIADLHSADFIVIDAPPCQTVGINSAVEVALLRSSYSDRYHGQALSLNWELWYDNLGVRTVVDSGIQQLAWNDYGVAPLEALALRMPKQAAVAVLALHLTTLAGASVTRNFVTFDVRDNAPNNQMVSVPVASFVQSQWEYQWKAIQEHKVNGGPSGHFTYEIQLPDKEELSAIYQLEVVFEASAKYLMGQNKTGSISLESDISFMHGANADPEYNRNSYLMTDALKQPSSLKVWVEDELIETVLLPDDPADSRGVLSWHYQPVSNKLNEAGSYGYFCRITLPSKLVAQLNLQRSLKVCLEAEGGGLALYGRNAGRYPIDLQVLINP